MKRSLRTYIAVCLQIHCHPSVSRLFSPPKHQFKININTHTHTSFSGHSVGSTDSLAQRVLKESLFVIILHYLHAGRPAVSETNAVKTPQQRQPRNRLWWLACLSKTQTAEVDSSDGLCGPVLVVYTYRWRQHGSFSPSRLPSCERRNCRRQSHRRQTPQPWVALHHPTHWVDTAAQYSSVTHRHTDIHSYSLPSHVLVITWALMYCTH